MRGKGKSEFFHALFVFLMRICIGRADSFSISYQHSARMKPMAFISAGGCVLTLIYTPLRPMTDANNKTISGILRPYLRQEPLTFETCLQHI